VIAARGSGYCSYYDQNRSGIVIENIGAETLAFIEVQVGPYLGEDDIVQQHDDFGRVTK
jgi:hypothetical protein